MRIFFRGNNPFGDVTLWETDATAAGTIEISNGHRGPVTSLAPYLFSPFGFASLNGAAIFNGAVDPQSVSGNRGLWRTDGTFSGTVQLFPSGASALGLNPTAMTPLNGRLVFDGIDAAGQGGVWITDGTSNGTVKISSVAGSDFTPFNGQLVYNGSNGGLWETYSNGSTIATQELFTVGETGPATNIAVLGHLALFNAADFSGHHNLWVTGSGAGLPFPAGVSQIVEVLPAGASASGLNPSNFKKVGNELLFNGTDASGKAALWTTDGTTAGTTEITGQWGLNPTGFTYLNGKLLFNGSSGAGFGPGPWNHLWVTDGTAFGTVDLLVPNEINSGLNPTDITMLNGKALFNGTNALGHHGLWITDGKIDPQTGLATGTFELLSNGASASGLDPSNLTLINGKLVFDGIDALGRVSLWETDGTAAGTIELFSGLGPNPQSLVAVNMAQDIVQATSATFASSGFAADVTGDGNKDWVQISDDNAVVWSSNGIGFSTPAVFTNGTTSTDRLADLNGDGKADLVQYFIGSDRAGHIYGALSNGSGFDAWTSWVSGATAADRLADISGDGQADLVQYFLGADHAGHIEVALSNGTSFNAYADRQTGAGPNDRLVDMNGDGKSDLVQLFQGREYVSLSTGSGFQAWSPWLTLGGTNQDVLADVEGIGRPDLIQFFHGRVLVAHNTGTGFGPWEDKLNSGAPAISDERFADVNGYGYASMVHIDSSTGNVFVAVANGTLNNTFAPFTQWGTGATTSDQLIDVNGDGRADLLQVTPSGKAEVALSTGSGFASWQVWSENHVVTGEAGHDNFVFNPNFGRQEITNFQPGTDTIRLDHTMFSDFDNLLAHSANDSHGNTEIVYDSNNALTLDGVLKTALTAGDLHLV